ncbi:efflux RND transporter periplasmic adaptor subunit [Pelagicoccus sp. SDUM812005]|uniref:efflux RND transporter periplasmic adaptor subunit n=1 Tax=Pelagicoccus sp. SDUM812005 TaxID=3041257 RepID=UPI00280FC085|nr:efflux RND transporter periplasmic adaptor subunit [Pelagicoccus sp. SDUM812005]MDQ8180514.1 efflux RND transporter periplasmic adaptor subunit [Pelagicoccus sp. SDUM812005]
MKSKPLSTMAAVAGVALLLGLGIGRFAFVPDGGHDHATAGSAAAGEPSASVEPSIWTCSMHPQIQQPAPGDCPICGMDLIPLEKDEGADEGPRVMSMSKSSRALAEIQTTPVQRGFPKAEVRLVGKLAYDETKEKSLTARFPARIDELFVNYTGIAVKQGEHLARVYSPELLTAQRELLTSYRSDPGSSITAAAREKLRLWDLLPDQIDAILERGQAKDHFTLRAPIGGVVVSKKVNEGDYVKTGESLFRIVDLNELWLFLDAYESDLAWLRYGQEVAFSVQAFPGETFHGQIAFIEPEVDSKTRTVQVRVNVPNRDGRLKPGMFAKGRVEARLAEGGKVYAPEFAGKWISPMHPEIVKDAPGECDVCGMDLVPAQELGYVRDETQEAPLYVPASAVLRTGERAVVYIEKPDTERPTYEGREITLGPRAGEHFIVAAGLQEGDRIVSKGAFKIDSALQIQAKPSMMNTQGGGPPPGHDHGPSSTRSEADGSGHEAAALRIEPEQAARLTADYLALQAALAGDDLDAAKSAVKGMSEASASAGELLELLREMLEAESLDALRRPHFEDLSNAMIAAAKAKPSVFDRSLTVMHCPMVYPDRGADWLQSGEPLQNPYFGAMMLTCGEVRETISDSEDAHDSHGH